MNKRSIFLVRYGHTKISQNLLEMSLVNFNHLKFSFILYTKTLGHNSGKILGHKLGGNVLDQSDCQIL